MILVLTGVAMPLVRTRGAPDDCVRVVPADLSRPGWTFDPDRPEAGRFATRNGSFGVEDLSGVLSCLPAVVPADLLHVARTDRTYVAAEMTAFLIAWVHALPCPVLDAPTPDDLGGRGLEAQRWSSVADRLGLPTAPRLPTSLSCPTVEVGVVGDEVRSSHHEAGVRARRLADELGAILLAPVFAIVDAEPVLIGVAPWWRSPTVGVVAAARLLRERAAAA